ncbi:MAG: hypothetical protein QXV22_04990 [Thermoplasmataceae archaeon]
MRIYECGECGERFLVERVFCPKCHSENIKGLEIDRGKVLNTVSLVATPEPYPDKYTLVLAEYDGTRFFCRSEGDVKPGDTVIVKETPDGLICESL